MNVTQFNWRRHWKRKVEPWLQYEMVQSSLDLGMSIHNPAWKRGDPPHFQGHITGDRVVQGKLSWYRPWGMCHWIAYFSMSIGVLNYPDLDWRFLAGDLHTVPVGYEGGNPKVVMDILLFDRMTAQESIALTQRKAVRGSNSVATDQHNTLNNLFIEFRVPAIRAVAKQEGVTRQPQPVNK